MSQLPTYSQNWRKAGRPPGIHTRCKDRKYEDGAVRTYTSANGVTYSWMPGNGKLMNPPNNVYELNSWCSVCRGRFPFEWIRCPDCQYHPKLRHSSRHSKKEVKRIE